MNCIIFLTHNFKEEFLNTLSKVDNDISANKFEIIVLFDNAGSYNSEIDNKFKHIKIIKIDKMNTTYDKLGHSMYLHYFKLNDSKIEKYNYIWLIENDVYYPDSIIQFINKHSVYDYDLMVGEYGTRDEKWCWIAQLDGFIKKNNIGVLAVIMRFSQKMLRVLIDTIDKKYFGYLEAVLPHICIENQLSIQQFLPELCGILTTNNKTALLDVIRKDITDKTQKYLENKIYHPIKL